MPLVYIIVLNWNGYDDTEECLRSLERVTYPNFKTLVVDNGSSDGSQALVEKNFPGTELLKNQKNLGFAGGNNEGIKYALGKGAEYILLLNNDTVVPPDFLGILVDNMVKDPGIGISGPKILYHGRKDRIWFAGGKIYYALGNTLHVGNRQKDGPGFKGILEEDYQTGCALLITRQALEKTGLLDTSYTAYFEDAGLCVRARRSGFKVICVRNSVIWHKVSSSTGGGLSPAKAYLKARNGVIFFRREAPRSLYYTTALFCALIYISGMSLLSLIRGKRGVFGGFISGLRDGVNSRSSR